MDGSTIDMQARLPTSAAAFPGSEADGAASRHGADRAHMQTCGAFPDTHMLQLILDGAPAAIAVFDADMRYVAASRRFLELHGAPGTHVIGRTQREAFPDTPPCWLDIHEYGRDGQIHCGENNSFPCADGRTKSVRWEISPWHTARGERGGCILFVEEAKLRGRDTVFGLHAATTGEKRAQNSGLLFVQAIHDMRQPIAALQLFVHLLKSDGELSPADSVALKTMSDCIREASTLLSQALDLTRLEWGLVTPTLVRFPVSEVLSDIVSKRSAEAQEKRLHLQCVPPSVVANTDRELFRCCVARLLDHVLCHTNWEEVLIRCRQHKDGIRVEIWGTGLGSLEEDFEMLNQTAANASLGSIVAARIAALLGFRIDVRSQRGKAAVFSIELPRTHVPESSAPKRGDLRDVPSRLRIALVDGHPAVRKAIAGALKALGNEVVDAEGGLELHTALEMAEMRPDIVVSDYQLACGESGYEVISGLRDRFGRDFPAILITGDADPALVRDMSWYGIVVLQKPLDPKTLQAEIETLVWGRTS